MEIVRRVVAVPEGISVTVKDNVIEMKGPKGTLVKDFANPRFIDTVRITADNGVTITSSSDKRMFKAMVGTIAAHVKNMIKGVTTGYLYTMKITYSHFPISVTIKDREVQIRNFFGEKGARVAHIIGSCNVTMDKDEITIAGISKEEVGQTSSNIEQACRISGKDRRIFQDGIFIFAKG